VGVRRFCKCTPPQVGGFITIRKYDPDGVELWHKDDGDMPKFVVCDAAGTFALSCGGLSKELTKIRKYEAVEGNRIAHWDVSHPIVAVAINTTTIFVGVSGATGFNLLALSFDGSQKWATDTGQAIVNIRATDELLYVTGPQRATAGQGQIQRLTMSFDQKVVANDLVVDHVNRNKVTSASHAFSDADVGLRLRIDGGDITQWSVGTCFTVTSVVGGAAVLDRIAGAADATGGRFTFGGPTTGTFALSWQGQALGSFSYYAQGGDLAIAFNSIPNLGPYVQFLSIGPLQCAPQNGCAAAADITVQFHSIYAGRDVPLIKADNTGMGGTGGHVEIDEMSAETAPAAFNLVKLSAADGSKLWDSPVPLTQASGSVVTPPFPGTVRAIGGNVYVNQGGWLNAPVGGGVYVADDSNGTFTNSISPSGPLAQVYAVPVPPGFPPSIIYTPPGGAQSDYDGAGNIFTGFYMQDTTGQVKWVSGFPSFVGCAGVNADYYSGYFASGYHANNAPFFGSQTYILWFRGKPNGGVFTLSFNGQTTGAISWPPSPGIIQNALQALPTVGSSGMFVSGSVLDGAGNLAATNPGNALIITCAGPLANAPQPQITASSNLTGAAAADGAMPAVAVEPTLLGGISSRTLAKFDAGGNVQWFADHSTKRDQGQTVGIAVDQNQFVFTIGNRVRA
jgi:hypothetical protein